MESLRKKKIKKYSYKKLSATSSAKDTNLTPSETESSSINIEDSMRIKLGLVCATKTKCRRLPHSPNRRMHWGEKARWTSAWKDAVYWEIKSNYPHAKIKQRAIITVYLYTTRPQDQDNSVASVKAIIDGLKKVVIEDDDPAHCEIHVKTEKVAHKADEHVEIEIK